MNPRYQYQNTSRRPYPQYNHNNRNVGGLLVGGALGYGLGYLTPRPTYYQPYPPFYYGPGPYYPPYYPPFRPF